MNYGPDLHGYALKEGICDLTADENRAGRIRNVEHSVCSSLKREDHWTFVHGDTLSVPLCDSKENLDLEGPASADDASIMYPCNLKH